MPIPVLLAAESSSTGLAALGISLPHLIFELINFAILFWLLKRYAYKPIVNALENRRKFIADSLAEADAARSERDKVVAERVEILEKARQHAAAIVTDARKEAEAKKNEIIADAESTADHIVEQAKRETDRQLDEARKKLEQEARELVVSATSALINEKLDPEKDSALIEKSLKTAEGVGRG